MRKSLSALVAVVLMVLVLPAAAFAQAGALRVTAERTSVRERPATDGGVVATVIRNEQLQIVETSGTWFRVRLSSGREGFVHSLFVERVGGGLMMAAPASQNGTTSTASSPVASPQASSTSAQSSGPRFGGNGSEPLGNRRFGVGVANIGPSIRYWMDAKKGFQVDGYFSGNGGYSVSAISPSFISRFSEPKPSGSMTFLPYWGAGVTLWHFEDGYNGYYCGRYNDCDDSSTSLGFGGYVGGELTFESLPKLAISGNAGYYTAHLGYGGFGIGLGVHFYPGAKR